MHADLRQATSDFCPVLAELLQTRAVRKTRALRILEVGLSFYEVQSLYSAHPIRSLAILQPVTTTR
jgi:hypothetical protein